MLNLWNWGVTIGCLILRQTQPTLTTLATSENVAFFGVRWLYFEVEQNDKLFADKSLQCRPMLSNKKPVWTPATISYDTSARTDLLFFTLWVPGFGEASCSIAAGLVLARQIGKACTVNHQLTQLTLWNLFATNMSIMSQSSMVGKVQFLPLLEGLCIWASTDITDQDMLKTSRFSRLVPPDNARNTYAYIYKYQYQSPSCWMQAPKKNIHTRVKELNTLLDSWSCCIHVFHLLAAYSLS